MARIRSAKPSWWTDPKMVALPREIRWTFKGLWEVCADDSGRFLADARVIKGQLWPMDDDITVKKVEKYLTSLAERGRIALYVVDDVRYGVVVNFLKHQKISHPTPSILPEPPLSSSGTPPEPQPNGSRKIPESFANDSVLSGAERDFDFDLERSGADAEGTVSAGARRYAAPPAPLLDLPNEANELLERFYSGDVDRRHDAVDQLRASLDRGAKISRGKYVKARDAAHLAACCQAVLDDPPRKQDLAVRFVLLKLNDPPKGTPQTERIALEERARIREEDAYHAAAEQAGAAWARDHPEESATITARVSAHFGSAPDTHLTRIARDAMLAQELSRACGFPDFETWRNERPRLVSA